MCGAASCRAVHGEAAPCVQLPRGDLICHAAPQANLPRFARLYSFLTRFSGQLLEAFWCSKWVIRDTVGNLEKSTFQQYKVRTNQGSDGKVMAPGSRVTRAVFSRFSGEDSDQTGDATGEPRVVSCSWSCSLSYVPELADQIAASRRNPRAKAVVWEEKRVGFSTRFPYFRLLSRAR
jgi:hypothetical protein